MTYLVNVVFCCGWIALTASGFIEAVRALPFVQPMLLEGRKPWACDICMSFWSTLLAGTALCCAQYVIGLDAVIGLLSVPPAYAITLVTLRFIQPPPADFKMPDLK